MITLILVGGNSQRFLNAGYTKPKCLLPMPNYATMLEWVVQALPCQRVVIAGREAHRSVLEVGVYDAYRWLVGAEKISMVWGEGKARGPLYGVLDARECLQSVTPLLVAYCDVIPLFSVGDALHVWQGAESGAVTFPSHDPRFGYWDGERVREKEAVSDRAVSGLFYFASTLETVKRAEAIAYDGAGIVHLLNAQTRMYEVSAREILDLGTPEAYEAFMGEGVRA